MRERDRALLHYSSPQPSDRATERPSVMEVTLNTQHQMATCVCVHVCVYLVLGGTTASSSSSSCSNAKRGKTKCRNYAVAHCAAAAAAVVAVLRYAASKNRLLTLSSIPSHPGASTFYSSSSSCSPLHYCVASSLANGNGNRIDNNTQGNAMEQKKEEAEEDSFLSGPFLIWSIIVRPSYLSSLLPSYRRCRRCYDLRECSIIKEKLEIGKRQKLFWCKINENRRLDDNRKSSAAEQ